MQKSRQKIKITHNLAPKNNHIDVVVPLVFFFFFLPVHMYFIRDRILHLYSFILRNSLVQPPLPVFGFAA